LQKHLKKNKSNSDQLKKIIIDAILDKKGHEVTELDLREVDSSMADYFLLCHGDSTTQVNALADAVYKKVKDELGVLPKGTEGKQNATWIVLDYFDIIVHIFLKETREYYQLEELWSDALLVEHS
jgi:ribosome-associated protein